MTSEQATIKAPQAALTEHLIRQILQRVLDRLDTQPYTERAHPSRVDLDRQIAPDIYAADSLFGPTPSKTSCETS